MSGRPGPIRLPWKPERDGQKARLCRLSGGQQDGPNPGPL